MTRADVVAVLGGGLEVRPFAAAELYKKGFVTKILISQVAESHLVEDPSPFQGTANSTACCF